MIIPHESSRFLKNRNFIPIATRTKFLLSSSDAMILRGCVKSYPAEQWIVCKYDDHTGFYHKVQKCQGMKAIDFLATDRHDWNE